MQISRNIVNGLKSNN